MVRADAVGTASWLWMKLDSLQRRVFLCHSDEISTEVNQNSQGL